MAHSQVDEKQQLNEAYKLFDQALLSPEYKRASLDKTFVQQFKSYLEEDAPYSKLKAQIFNHLIKDNLAHRWLNEENIFVIINLHLNILKFDPHLYSEIANFLVKVSPNEMVNFSEVIIQIDQQNPIFEEAVAYCHIFMEFYGRANEDAYHQFLSLTAEDKNKVLHALNIFMCFEETFIKALLDHPNSAVELTNALHMLACNNLYDEATHKMLLAAPHAAHPLASQYIEQQALKIHYHLKSDAYHIVLPKLAAPKEYNRELVNEIGFEILKDVYKLPTVAFKKPNGELLERYEDLLFAVGSFVINSINGKANNHLSSDIIRVLNQLIIVHSDKAADERSYLSWPAEKHEQLLTPLANARATNPLQSIFLNYFSRALNTLNYKNKHYDSFIDDSIDYSLDEKEVNHQLRAKVCQVSHEMAAQIKTFNSHPEDKMTGLPHPGVDESFALASFIDFKALNAEKIDHYFKKPPYDKIKFMQYENYPLHTIPSKDLVWAANLISHLPEKVFFEKHDKWDCYQTIISELKGRGTKKREDLFTLFAEKNRHGEELSKESPKAAKKTFG